MRIIAIGSALIGLSGIGAVTVVSAIPSNAITGNLLADEIVSNSSSEYIIGNI